MALDRDSLCDALRELVELLLDDLREQVATDRLAADRLDTDHQRLVDAGRSAAPRGVVLEEQLIHIAMAWVIGTVFLRFAEDNKLIDTSFIGGPRDYEDADTRREEFFSDNSKRGDRDWLITAFQYLADSHPVLTKIFDPDHNPLWLAMPSHGAARSLLTTWRQSTPNGTFAYNLTDANLDTQFLVRLYEGLSEHAHKTHAMVPTPDFVAEHILDLTLNPALDEYGPHGLRVIDPACGSGNFVVAAFNRLVRRWTQEAPEMPAEQHVGLALTAVHGVDLNPSAVAITRFRLLTAALHATGYSMFSSTRYSGWRLPIAVGDSLLGTTDDPPSAEDIGAHPEILGPGSYHAVFGNPPYLTVKDRLLSQRYRERYDACTGPYSLVVPFNQLMFWLARPRNESKEAGYVGILTANSFMKRQFGRKLIEDFYANNVTLTHVIDTSGAFIPGHGTAGSPCSPITVSTRSVAFAG